MSDDGLRAALVAIKAKLQARSDEGEAHLFLNIPYWELEELLAQYPPHLTDDGATDTPPADSTGVGAPAAAESATTTAAPSSPRPCDHSESLYGRCVACGKTWETQVKERQAPHRATCGTTYGESCDGYCPTPAIDREQISERLAEAMADSWMGDEVDCADVATILTPAVVALIEGAS